MCRCRALMDELDDDSLTAIEVQRMLLLADREAQQEHAVLRQAPQARLTEGRREGDTLVPLLHPLLF